MITGVQYERATYNLKVRNNTVKNAKRITRGAAKKETETVLIEFDVKDFPIEIHFRFIKYSVRESIPKPVRCLNCQEYGHMLMLKQIRWLDRRN